MGEMMKKIFLFMFLAIFALTNVTFARVQYDSTGRKVIYNDSIRARRNAQQINHARHYQAAAKINYDEQKNNNEIKSNLKANYYQMKKESK